MRIEFLIKKVCRKPVVLLCKTRLHVKIFLCFMSGFGFDAVFFNESSWRNPVLLKVSLAFSSLLMMLTSLFLWILSHNYKLCEYLLRSMAPQAKDTLPLFTNIFNEDIIIPLLNHTTLFALSSFILFIVVFS